METARAELIMDEPALPSPNSSAPEYWVDRGEDGRAIIKCILESAAPLIVFHGKRGIGKSELLHRWVIPQIPQGCRVFYGNGEDKLTSLTERDRASWASGTPAFSEESSSWITLMSFSGWTLTLRPNSGTRFWI